MKTPSETISYHQILKVEEEEEVGQDSGENPKGNKEVLPEDSVTDPYK